MPKRAKTAEVRPIGDLHAAVREYAHHAALEARAAHLAGRPPAAASSPLPEAVQAALGEQAETVRAIIAHLALGAAASDPLEARAALDKQVALVIEGVSPRLRRAAPKNGVSGHGRPQLFQSDLWQLLHKLRESAELSFARELRMIELDRRILFFLRQLGPLTPAGISAASGVDKAQVSRSIKRLLELDMVERRQIRSPISLTRTGAALTDRLARLAELRNRELTLDIGDDELAEFLSAVEILLDRAVQLYDRERELSGGRGQAETDLRAAYGLEEQTDDKIVLDRARVVSPLLTLMSYYSRSGALAFKRTTGLSNFEAWVLSEISFNAPTDWSRLVGSLQRDHSQAGRTVNALIDQGLVRREGLPRRRHGRFSPTAEGRAVYQVIFETGQKRAEFLLAPLEARRLERFMATFDKIRRNASAQLARERTLQELETG